MQTHMHGWAWVKSPHKLFLNESSVNHWEPGQGSIARACLGCRSGGGRAEQDGGTGGTEGRQCRAWSWTYTLTSPTVPEVWGSHGAMVPEHPSPPCHSPSPWAGMDWMMTKRERGRSPPGPHKLRHRLGAAKHPLVFSQPWQAEIFITL